MNIENYRIEDKQNVNYAGKKTSYKIFVKNRTAGGFVFSGTYYAIGHDITDAACIADYEERQTISEEHY